MRFPVFPLAVSVAVVGLGTLSTLGQVVAVLATLEALELGDPKDLCIVLIHLLSRIVLDTRLKAGTATGAVIMYS